jgi:hypothetical protein
LTAHRRPRRDEACAENDDSRLHVVGDAITAAQAAPLNLGVCSSPAEGNTHAPGTVRAEF